MSWILNHLWIVIVIAGMVARMLQAARGKQPPVKDAGPPDRGFEDPDLAERTRKIREEIRRKIDERRGQLVPPPAPEPGRPRLRTEDRSPEATPPPLVLELPPLVRGMFSAGPEPVPSPAESAAAAGELARQAALAEQLRVVMAARAASDERTARAIANVNEEQAALSAGRVALLDDLREADSLRRAFVLREVLGPPLALRN